MTLKPSWFLVQSFVHSLEWKKMELVVLPHVSRRGTSFVQGPGSRVPNGFSNVLSDRL